VDAADGSAADGADPRRETVTAFIDHLAHQRRLSPATCDGYARDLERLLALTPGVGFDRIAPHTVRRSVAQLHSRGLSGRTLARMLSAWRTFFRWLARHHGLAANPCAGIRAPKVPKGLPKALSPDAAQRLLDAPLEDGALALRDKAMFELFYSSGLRLAELVSLDVSQAASIRRDREVTVTGKGSRTRTVPVGTRAVAALDAWTAVRALHARPEEPALFVGARGRRIDPSIVQSALKRWALRAGLTENVHPHVLRHSFASHVLQSSGDLRAVQEMLGHASISTTQVYTHLDFQHLAKVYDAAHPRARKKK
jgi:integrase/recombinase XerC